MLTLERKKQLIRTGVADDDSKTWARAGRVEGWKEKSEGK